MTVFALSYHQQYGCRHSGACCTAGWSIPVEPRLLPLLGTELLVPDGDGACAHFDRASRLCEVQREHGEDMLPGSCYQFPRRALIDDRGTFVTLSNFCPTAAALLYDSTAPLGIIDAPPAFPSGRRYEGLDARGQWPPLVRPDLLFDLASYSRWERFIVSVLAEEASVRGALVRIASVAETLRTWTPVRGLFDDWSTAILRAAPSACAPDADALGLYVRYHDADAYETLRRFVPEGLAAPAPFEIEDGDAPVFETSNEHSQAMRRYLAGKAFGAWTAYDGRGVRTQIAELIVAALVLRVECQRASRAAGRHGRIACDRAITIEALRQSDLLLMHLIDRPRMLEWLGHLEGV